MLSALILGTAISAAPVTPRAAVQKPFLLQFTEEVAETATLGQLSHTPVTDGSEIRIWVGFGIVTPEHMLRLRVDRSGKVSGQLWVYFPSDLTYIEDIHERHRIRREWTHDCSNLKHGKEHDVCIALFREAPDWTSTHRNLVSLGVTELPDESELPKPKSTVLDGVAMVVEVRDEHEYRGYAYSNPMFREGPEAKAAVSILDAVGEIIRSYGR